MTAEEFKKACDAVEGYTALGLLDEATNILEDLPSELKITKEVITLHMGILLKAGEYLKASYLAETLSMSEPDDVDRMVLVARYRYKAGEHADALAWLVSVARKCSGGRLFPLSECPMSCCTWGYAGGEDIIAKSGKHE